MIRIDVDPGQAAQRTLSEIEQRQLPFATMQAINQTSFAVRDRWAEIIPRIFDNPTPLTRRAVLFRRATRQNLEAFIFFRDQAAGGTAPAKYLQEQVFGGQRRAKRSDKALQAKGVMPNGYFWVPGKEAKRDRFGNLPRSVIKDIIQKVGLGSEGGESRGPRYFVVKRREGRTRHLGPGIYRRVRKGDATEVRSVMVFVRTAKYRPRFEIGKITATIYQRRFPAIFAEQLARAVANARPPR